MEEKCSDKILLLGENINLKDFMEFEVVGIVSGKKDEIIDNIPVYTYDYLLNLPADHKVIIVDDNWEFEVLHEFNLLMKKLGLRIGDHYIYHSMMGGCVNTNIIYRLSDYSQDSFHDLMKTVIGNRELVVLYGNCQIQVLIDMIGGNEEFRKKYVTCRMPRFWEQEDENEYKLLFESHILCMASYLFTQEVSVSNRFGYVASTEYVISHLSKDCEIITIANLYFEGYFPQLKDYGERVNWWKGKFPTFCGYTDREVLKLISMGKNDQEILEEISSVDYYSSKQIKMAIEHELEKFELRENSIEIKMSDFLKENYDKFLMFVTVNHPTRDVLIEFAGRILTRLGIHDRYIPYEETEIPQQMPNIVLTIYPSVFQCLGLPMRKFPFRAKLYNDELVVLTGIDEDLDQFIAENEVKENNLFNVNLMLDFKEYMLIYLRTLRAAIHI